MIRKIIYPSFLRRSIVGGGRPLLREILGQPTPVGDKMLSYRRETALVV